VTPAVQALVRCPSCHGTLADLRCATCAVDYPRNGDVVDLRLQRARDVTLAFRVGDLPLRTDALAFEPLVAHPSPAVDFASVAVPNHLSAAMLSHFPAAPERGALALDLGCGWGVHRAVVEHAGYEWVGVDYAEEGAPILGDAHALPFADSSFDFVLSIAVLEHLRYPFVAMSEALRVIRPGGTMIGTVAFLEPFHGDSHYHHTHLGTLNTLLHAGFDVEAIAPHADWMVMRAQSEMGLFPSTSPRVRRAVTAAVDRLHRRAWRRSGGDERARLRNTTGAFTFVARKPST
jgi:SAM-dependent methyltransferase